jgi:hypothetical protein
MDDATFKHERLASIIEQLRARRRELHEAEENAQKRTAYERVKTERDKQAAELAKFYPEFAERLADLLSRIKKNDSDVAIVNGQLPSGEKPLLVAELVARGLTGSIVNGTEVPRIRDAVLPAFEPNPHTPFSWPRPQASSVMVQGMLEQARKRSK